MNNYVAMKEKNGNEKANSLANTQLKFLGYHKLAQQQIGHQLLYDYLKEHMYVIT